MMVYYRERYVLIQFSVAVQYYRYKMGNIFKFFIANRVIFQYVQCRVVVVLFLKRQRFILHADP
jgi:hypothetical protein